MSSQQAQYILWDPSDGPPWRNDDGSFISEGVVGRITAGNAFLTVYAQFPEDVPRSRLRELDVGGSIKGVKYSLSGSEGVYDVYRVS